DAVAPDDAKPSLVPVGAALEGNLLRPGTAGGEGELGRLFGVQLDPSQARLTVPQLNGGGVLNPDRQCHGRVRRCVDVDEPSAVGPPKNAAAVGLVEAAPEHDDRRHPMADGPAPYILPPLARSRDLAREVHHVQAVPG